MSASPIGEGEKLPDFELPTDGGGRIGTGSLRGKPFVLYLYPKDDTTGCTKEAQGFTAAYGDFKALGVEVIGLSKDDTDSHDRFKVKYGLAFPLASDDAGLVERLGAWVEKSMYGKTYMGIDRSTFLVDEGGVVRKAWRQVNVPGHVEEVLAAAQAMLGK